MIGHRAGRYLCAGILLAALPFACVPFAAGATPSQSDLDGLARDMGFRYASADNQPANCPEAGNCFTLDLVLTTPATLPANAGVEIRYSLVNSVISVDSPVFANRSIGGDLQSLTMKPGAVLSPSNEYRLHLMVKGHAFSRYQSMPNAHISIDGLAPRLIVASRTATDPDSGLETVPFVAPYRNEAKLAAGGANDRTVWLTPERAFARYAARPAGPATDIAIIPLPGSVSRTSGPQASLAGGLNFQLSGIDRADIAAAIAPLSAAYPSRGAALPVAIVIAPGQAPEAYRLTVTAKAIRIDASDASGAAYALRSLMQQAAFENGKMRPLTIEDAPRFPFRGLLIDVARNFHSKAEILKVIEQMARFKLNKIHLHLADDEGWRLAIAALPELTEIGAYRCADASEKTCLLPQLGGDSDRAASTNGFFTRADYMDILRAAKARQIEVIPSFDMPGHSRAAIRSMEVRYARLMAAGRKDDAEKFRLVEPEDTTQYTSIQNYHDNTLNICIDSTYRFLDTVIDALTAMHLDAGTPLKTYHIGADETAGAWRQSPACKAVAKGGDTHDLVPHFIERVAADLAARGIKVAGWSDGMGHVATAAMPKSVQSNIWGLIYTGAISEAHDHANRGWDVVLSIPDVTYFDMPYATDPEEPGYDWASRGLDSFRAFAFMPENLPANASLIPDTLANNPVVVDKIPLAGGRRVTGIQAQLFSETVRSDAKVDYMLFPRLLAMAERAWTKAGWEKPYVAGASFRTGDNKVDLAAINAGWGNFARRVSAQIHAFHDSGIQYRITPPGAHIRKGVLHANTEYPGMIIEYKIRNTPWTRYLKPTSVTAAVDLRSRFPGDKRTSRVVSVTP